MSVPDLSGMTYEKAEEVLKNASLQYEISLDSGFSAEEDPLVILKQLPEANALVKKDRKIFLTLNARNAPILKMPSLLNMPLKMFKRFWPTLDCNVAISSMFPILASMWS